MSSIQSTSRVHAPLACAYGVVSDIESYPEFVSACRSARVLSSTDCGDYELVEAQLIVSLGIFKKSLTTTNTNIPNKKITIKLHSGEVKKLQGVWKFTYIAEDITEVSCHISFNLGSEKINEVANVMLKKFVVQLAKSFVDRTQALGRGLETRTGS